MTSEMSPDGRHPVPGSPGLGSVRAGYPLPGPRGSGGGPDYTESDLPSKGQLGRYEQRVYYGEKTTQYSIVGGPQKELDYSDDTGEKSYRYTGKSGVNLSNPVGANLVTAAATGTIIDVVPSTITIGDASVLKTNNGQAPVATISGNGTTVTPSSRRPSPKTTCRSR